MSIIKRKLNNHKSMIITSKDIAIENYLDTINFIYSPLNRNFDFNFVKQNLQFLNFDGKYKECTSDIHCPFINKCYKSFYVTFCNGDPNCCYNKNYCGWCSFIYHIGGKDVTDFRKVYSDNEIQKIFNFYEN